MRSTITFKGDVAKDVFAHYGRNGINARMEIVIYDSTWALDFATLKATIDTTTIEIEIEIIKTK